MTNESRIRVFGRPEAERGVGTLGCPGCGHGITWRILAEVIGDLGILDRTICCAGVGCHDWFVTTRLFNFDQILCLHGRAPAVATGARRVLPSDRVIFTIQGDGDMVGEGCAEIIHAASRAERITTILCNNANFGETGGHLCPTTLMGQRTKTSPYGRNLDVHGYPLQMAEMLVPLPGVTYVARGAICSPAHVMEIKRMIRRAFEVQMSGDGLTFVEVLTPCPSGWSLSPIDALKFVADEMVSFNQLGELKTPPIERKKEAPGPVPGTAATGA